MRRLVMAMALAMLSACTLTPSKHALIFVSVNHVVAAMAEHANAEMRDERIAEGGDDITPEAHARLEATWRPVITSLNASRKVLDRYELAIERAEESGDTALLRPYARDLVEQWAAMESAAERLGYPFPDVPKRLVEFAASGGVL